MILMHESYCFDAQKSREIRIQGRSVQKNTRNKYYLHASCGRLIFWDLVMLDFINSCTLKTHFWKNTTKMSSQISKNKCNQHLVKLNCLYYLQLLLLKHWLHNRYLPVVLHNTIYCYYKKSVTREFAKLRRGIMEFIRKYWEPFFTR